MLQKKDLKPRKNFISNQDFFFRMRLKLIDSMMEYEELFSSQIFFSKEAQKTKTRNNF